MRILGVLLFFLSIAQLSGQNPKITTVLSGIPASIRGLSVVDDQVAWFSGSKGYAGRSTDGGKSWRYNQVKTFEKVDFRSLFAFDSLKAIIANAGSPASILKTVDGGRIWREVYRSDHPDIFLDGVDFWDARSGIIYGDPIDGKMTLLKTTDGGDSWIEIPSSQRPSLEKGEASFAASGTGIRCYEKNKVIVATGGMVSRLWFSEDGGASWVPGNSPIVQGKNSAGIFSVGIISKILITVGGDFSADSLSHKNAFYSLDEGKTWKAPEKSTRGYRSCVEFLDGTRWIAAGQTGLDISTDNGKNWIPLADEKGIHVVRKARQGKRILAAGNGKIVRIE